MQAMKAAQLRHLRRNLQIVFQDPYAALDPRMTIGQIIGEPLRVHGEADAAQRERQVKELLEMVGLQRGYYHRYPHEFSGGQRQRVSIARALALRPKLILCDEPVSALDVSIQSQILNLLRSLQSEFGLTYIFISHALNVVRYVSDRVGVMYLGKLVELAPVKELYTTPRHPYTRALLSAIPIPDPTVSRERILLQGDRPTPRTRRRAAGSTPAAPSPPTNAAPPNRRSPRWRPGARWPATGRSAGRSERKRPLPGRGRFLRAESLCAGRFRGKLEGSETGVEGWTDTGGRISGRGCWWISCSKRTSRPAGARAAGSGGCSPKAAPIRTASR